MTKPVLIRRYTDRRLYDTAASGYVKLEDIARMVREGTDVKVVDARSGREITSVVLTQIIVEDARGRDSALPLQLLRTLIRASDHATHDFVSWYLNHTFELYQKAQEGIRSRLSEATNIASSPMDFVRKLLPLPEEGAAPARPPGPDPSPGEAKEIARLRRRVKRLEAQLETARGSGRRSPKSRGSRN
ncbi:MAG TPA: polyhydroxyalkanoate synthesis regulator DNA-binding domain-containing protein [Terriglobia bacterium]|nr:polyhydroxyalkanoate synthesis regulator DNA-binding domain-containing protein [Terriglobia bacterium]